MRLSWYQFLLLSSFLHWKSANIKTVSSKFSFITFLFILFLKSKSFNPRRKLLMPGSALEGPAVHQLCAFAARCKALVRLADAASAGGRKRDTRRRDIPPNWELKCSQFPSCVDFTGFNCIQNCVYCYYLSFFSKIALKHRPHYFHI